MNLLQRAYHGLPLTPGERAFLKFVQHFAIAAAGAVLTAVLSYVASLQSLITAGNYGQAVQLVGFVAASAVCAAGFKYVTSSGDTRLAPLGSALDAYGVMFQQQAADLGANLPKVPATPVDASDGTPADGGGVPAASPDQASVAAPVAAVPTA